MRRPYRIVLIIAAVVVFLIISGLLARAFSVGGAESDAITSLVKAEARGDGRAVVALIEGCSASPTCRAAANALATRLRHPGTLSIPQVNPSTSFSLGSTLGTARVAWFAGNSTARVQCVRVRHAGNVLSGFHVQLLIVSRRIASGADCPIHFGGATAGG
jgi:hypothetical protein